MGHDGAKRGHDSAKMGHDSGKMGSLRSTLDRLGQFWEHFSRILGDGWESEKHSKIIGFLWFLALLGGLEEVSEHLGGCLGRCWLEGYVFRKFFGHVGDKRTNSRGKMATGWPQDGS